MDLTWLRYSHVRTDLEPCLNRLGFLPRFRDTSSGVESSERSFAGCRRGKPTCGWVEAFFDHHELEAGERKLLFKSPPAWRGGSVDSSEEEAAAVAGLLAARLCVMPSRPADAGAPAAASSAMQSTRRRDMAITIASATVVTQCGGNGSNSKTFLKFEPFPLSNCINLSQTRNIIGAIFCLSQHNILSISV